MLLFIITGFIEFLSFVEYAAVIVLEDGCLFPVGHFVGELVVERHCLVREFVE